MSKQAEWEYKVITNYYADMDIKELTSLGKLGWELTSISSGEGKNTNNYIFCFYFKRLIKKDN